MNVSVSWDGSTKTYQLSVGKVNRHFDTADEVRAVLWAFSQMLPVGVKIVLHDKTNNHAFAVATWYD